MNHGAHGGTAKTMRVYFDSRRVAVPAVVKAFDQ
jgi:hypothetical protein